MDIYQEITNFYHTVEKEKRIIGRTLFGRNLYAIKIGRGNPIGVAQYAIHGREFITARLAVAHYEKGLKKGSCWLLPLMNPDGCLLSEKGISTVENRADKERLLLLNKGNLDFSLWKANGRGVDLNVNFDAKWGEGIKNLRKAGEENYIGEAPFSEPETRALKEFTEEIKPDYTVSYHTKGEEIYWYFSQSTHTCPLHFALAQTIAYSTGYEIAQVKGSVGGYKDWCIHKWGIPSFTIEAGKDKFSHPLGEEAFEDILKKNENVLYDLSASIADRIGIE